MLTKDVPYNHQNIIPHIIFFESHMFGTSISHIKTQKKGELCAESSSKMGCSPMGLIHFSPANCCCYDDQPNHGHLSATRKFENSTSFDKGSGETPLDKAFPVSHVWLPESIWKRPCWLQRQFPDVSSLSHFIQRPEIILNVPNQFMWVCLKLRDSPKCQDSNAHVNMMINHRVGG